MEYSHEKAAFFGKVTASVTHEIQNVLAIIKETSGLMEDFFLMSRQGNISNIDEKIDKCLKTIKGQTYRGVALTSALNGFAHTADHIQVSIDVFDTAGKLISITERLFRQRNITVSISEPPKNISIITDPVLFQMALFSGVECLAGCFQAETMSIVLDILSSDKSTGVQVRYADNMDGCEEFERIIIQEPHWKPLCSVSEKIGFTVEMAADVPGICILLK